MAHNDFQIARVNSKWNSPVNGWQPKQIALHVRNWFAWRSKIIFFSSSKIKDHQIIKLLRSKPVIPAIPFGRLFSPICKKFFIRVLENWCYESDMKEWKILVHTLFMYFKSTAPNCSCRNLIVSGNTLLLLLLLFLFLFALNLLACDAPNESTTNMYTDGALVGRLRFGSLKHATRYNR